jgi:hypothetical protein
MSHIFISYSKQNIAFARRLRHLLEAEGFAVWMDETRLVPSERWWPTIEKKYSHLCRLYRHYVARSADIRLGRARNPAVGAHPQAHLPSAV